ncbi:Retrovirus-related Pol polyprotein from transposon TNT 1-94 [Sesamum angolense]|uniref:Retrovirus-related Pol polyprotein from transposon TNT 1-94 n=1 Tax=Sesamum angolense TaxID=2727404 RepID=A0AAE1WG00_9LAMI|nr:Retrovirus-related Pol polyprotein from transposon TNT 1-94 [Sesamum angolense]
MKGILIQQKVFKAIDGKYADNVSDDKKLENDEYKLDMSKNIDENIDEFTKLIQDIKLTGDKNIDDYSPIVLLNAIPETYGDVKAAIKYGRDNVQLETVVSGLKSKEIDLKISKSSQNTSEVNFNVRHVPDLAQNLISCSALEEEGLEGKWVHQNVSDLWHKRLGHISSKGLDLLHNHGILKEKLDKLSFCDDCILGKHHRVHFPSTSKSMTSSCILEYVHADVWGPANVPTHGGNKYFLSIIDNFSRKVFVFLMKQKSEVFEKFRNWKIFVENQTGKNLKTLRTDNGLEFCNQQFTSLCDEFGIKRHKTTPYTPQQNGVAERMNRTLLNKVRCLLISSGLSKTFWGEALSTAVYLINRSPSVPLLGKIPECMWTGKDVDISSLRIFGCSAFVLQNGDKLDPRAKKCIFIGYPVGVKGYRLWLRNQPGYKVIVSRDVTFNESEFPCLANSSKKDLDHNIESTFNKVEDNPEDNQQGEEVVIEENQQLENEEQNENNTPSIRDYQLARDRERRTTRIPSKLRL